MKMERCLVYSDKSKNITKEQLIKQLKALTAYIESRQENRFNVDLNIYAHIEVYKQ